MPPCWCVCVARFDRFVVCVATTCHTDICRSFAARRCCCCAIPFAVAAAAAFVFARTLGARLLTSGCCRRCWLLALSLSAVFSEYLFRASDLCVCLCLSVSPLHLSSLPTATINQCSAHARPMPTTLGECALMAILATPRLPLSSDDALPAVPDPGQKKNHSFFIISLRQQQHASSTVGVRIFYFLNMHLTPRILDLSVEMSLR